MKYIDLHVHSHCSDGSCTPKELVHLAAEAGLSAFALTDHDTLFGISEAAEAADRHSLQHPEAPIEVVPGVEISAAFREKDIHILGLLVNPHSQELVMALEQARLERDNRNERMAAALEQAGIRLDIAAIQASNPGAVITRAHFAGYLVETKQAKDYKTAFDLYLGDETPYYIPRKFIEPEDAIHLIRSAGGIPVLAHPLLYHLDDQELRALLTRLCGYGLLGIETLYSNHEQADEDYIRRLAKEFGLLITGGSDFHGTPKPSIHIGVGRGNLRIPYTLLEELRRKASQLSRS